MKTAEEKSNKNCQDCAKYHSEQCPNSFDCYNTVDKPFFIKNKIMKTGDEQRYYKRLKMHEELIDLINSHRIVAKTLTRYIGFIYC